MSKNEPIEDAVQDAPMLEHSDLDEVLHAQDAPCISIYVPTSPVTDRKDKNRILYKDQAQKVMAALENRGTDKRLMEHLMSHLESVGVNDDFWINQQYGLAVLLSPERFMVRRLMRSPDAMGIVADEFHLRPLLRETRNWMRYRVLCVSLHDVALYDCDRELVTPVSLHPHVPRSMAQALGQTENAPDRKDIERMGDDSKDIRQYFQRIDQAIREHHNGGIDRPLILATVAEHQGLFREVSRHPDLLPEGLECEPFQEIEQDRLGEATWRIAESALATRVDAWVERYRTLEADGEGVTELEAVARAAAMGQVETVLIDENTRVEGRLDTEDGTVRYGETGDGANDDVLDAVAQLVLHHGGSVRFLPADRMPDGATAAALLRYQAGLERRVV
jgi:hypothetical protein